MENIVLFMDMNSKSISTEVVLDVVKKLDTRGQIIYGKLYNYKARKEKELAEVISARDFETAPILESKRKKELDIRMVVDILNLVYTNPKIETVCIFTAEGNIVPLVKALKLKGKYVIGGYGVTEKANMDICNENFTYQITPIIIKKQVAKPVTKKTVPVKKTAPKLPVKQTKPQAEPKVWNFQKKKAVPSVTKTIVKQVSTIKPEEKPKEQKIWNFQKKKAVPNAEVNPVATKSNGQTPVVSKTTEKPKEQKIWNFQKRKTVVLPKIEKPVFTKGIGAKLRDNEDVEIEIEQPKVWNFQKKKAPVTENAKQEIKTSAQEEVETKKQHNESEEEFFVKTLEGFAERTSTLNFEHNEDVEEKQSLLNDIETFVKKQKVIQDQKDSYNPEIMAVLRELGNLVIDIRATMDNDGEDDNNFDF